MLEWVWDGVWLVVANLWFIPTEFQPGLCSSGLVHLLTCSTLVPLLLFDIFQWTFPRLTDDPS